MENLINKIIDVTKEEWSFVTNKKLNGMVYLGGEKNISFKEPDTLESIKDNKLSEIKKQYNDSISQLVDESTTQEEKDSWDLQETEARAYLSDFGADTPLIDNMLLTRPSYTKETLVEVIIYKADLYKQHFGKILGLYQERIKLLNEAETIEDVKNI